MVNAGVNTEATLCRRSPPPEARPRPKLTTGGPGPGLRVAAALAAGPGRCERYAFMRFYAVRLDCARLSRHSPPAGKGGRALRGDRLGLGLRCHAVLPSLTFTAPCGPPRQAADRRGHVRRRRLLRGGRASQGGRPRGRRRHLAALRPWRGGRPAWGLLRGPGHP